MPTTTADRKASRAPRTAVMEFEEGGVVIAPHRPDPALTRSAIDNALDRMRRNKKRGDVVQVLREFRDNPRG